MEGMVEVGRRSQRSIYKPLISEAANRHWQQYSIQSMCVVPCTMYNRAVSSVTGVLEANCGSRTLKSPSLTRSDPSLGWNAVSGVAKIMTLSRRALITS